MSSRPPCQGQEVYFPQIRIKTVRSCPDALCPRQRGRRDPCWDTPAPLCSHSRKQKGGWWGKRAASHAGCWSQVAGGPTSFHLQADKPPAQVHIQDRMNPLNPLRDLAEPALRGGPEGKWVSEGRDPCPHSVQGDCAQMPPPPAQAGAQAMGSPPLLRPRLGGAHCKGQADTTLGAQRVTMSQENTKHCPCCPEWVSLA